MFVGENVGHLKIILERCLQLLSHQHEAERAKRDLRPTSGLHGYNDG
jgi:hypothetical protein